MVHGLQRGGMSIVSPGDLGDGVTHCCALVTCLLGFREGDNGRARRHCDEWVLCGKEEGRVGG